MDLANRFAIPVRDESIPFDGAPDGLAVIGWDAERATFLQHCFDDRTAVRVYELRLEDGCLTLERTQQDVDLIDSRLPAG